MRIVSFCELKNKEVINVCDGTRLGFVSDIEMDIENCRVVSLLLPADGKLFSFSKCDPVRVLWCDVERIGDDVILVRHAERIPPRCSDKKCDC